MAKNIVYKFKCPQRNMLTGLMGTHLHVKSPFKVEHTFVATSGWILIWKASETTNTPIVLLHFQICKVELISV